MLKLENIPNYEKYHFLIDLSNICYCIKSLEGKPMLENYFKVKNYLIEKLNIPKENLHAICDANLIYKIDQHGDLKTMIRSGEVQSSPSGRRADDFILNAALQYDFCFIISNDTLKIYLSELPDEYWLRDRKISLMIIDDKVCLSPDIDNTRVDLIFLNKNRVNEKNKDYEIDLLKVNLQKTIKNY